MPNRRRQVDPDIPVVSQKVMATPPPPNFTPATGMTWDCYVQLFNFYLEVNNVQDNALKRGYLCTLCGTDTYQLLVSLIAPRQVTDLSYEEIVTTLTNHYQPIVSEIAESFKFHNYIQGPDEFAAEYIANLRRLALKCNFADLERMLRDRFVCGLRDVQLQQRLLTHRSLTLEEAVNIAAVYETAHREASQIHGVQQETEINQVTARSCFRCTARHSPDTCNFRTAKCRYCNKLGHIEKACYKKRREVKSVKSVEQQQDEEVVEIQSVYSSSSNSRNKVSPYTVTVVVDGRPIEMEVDSGASVTIISYNLFKRFWPRTTLRSCPDTLTTWDKNKLRLIGTCKVTVEFHQHKKRLLLTVIEGTGPCLLGRSWFQELGISLTGIHHVTSPGHHHIKTTFEQLKIKYASVFQDGLGRYTGAPVQLHWDQTIKPIYMKSRPVPLALREKVEAEIDRLVNEGVLEPVSYSRWATPVVPIVKPTGDIRLCGDYKCTVNRVVLPDKYPLPSITELLSSIAGAKLFTKLDLAQAYTQLPVDDKAADLLTINTTKGLHRVKRLAFGVNAAPGIFQRLMSGLLSGIDGVVTLLDDILVTGTDMSQHVSRLELVLTKLQDVGLRLKPQKCEFGAREVIYLGYKIDKFGVHPTEDKIKAIKNAPRPSNKQELQSFLGLVNFYQRFIRNKSTLLEPLHRLLDTKS